MAFIKEIDQYFPVQMVHFVDNVLPTGKCNSPTLGSVNWMYKSSTVCLSPIHRNIHRCKETHIAHSACPLHFTSVE